MTITAEQALQIARAQQQAGQSAAAEATFRRIVAQQPEHAEALYRLGVIALAAGRFDEAADVLARASVQLPAQAEIHCDLGVAHRFRGDIDEAITCFRRAIELRGDLPDAHSNLGEALVVHGRFEEAIASCARAVALRPDYSEAHDNLGAALAQCGHAEEAIACFQRALSLAPGNASAHNNLGKTLLNMGRWDEAIACFERALALKPDIGDSHSNLGGALFGKGEYAGTLAANRELVRLHPEFAAAHWSLALVLLLFGHYEEGWREHEWRLRCRGYTSPHRKFAPPRWEGGRIEGGTILLHAEQGLGDTLQFMRYVPLVRQRSGASRVIVECPPELARMLAGSGGWNAEIVAREDWDGAALPPFDAHLPMLSLPLALGMFEPLPMSAPLVCADAALRAQWRERLRPGFRVGLAWAGNPGHKNNASRSMAFEKMSRLLRVTGVDFYSLQIEPRAPGDTTLIDLTAHLTDFADTAALLAELDLVITVDTAVAHLAGALGRPVWTLLPLMPDWRWGIEREDTPWYPTMRLFRQRTMGDWDEVVRRVALELDAMR